MTHFTLESCSYNTRNLLKVGQGAAGEDYYYDDDGNVVYYDAYANDYDTDRGEDVIIAATLIFSWAGLAVAGFFLFPPAFICLAHTGGDLNFCSFSYFK